MEDRIPISELEIGFVDQRFLLVDASVDETQNGDPYLRATLQDRSGELPLIQWDTDEAPESGVYRVGGMVETYQGRRQIKADTVQATEADVDPYVPTSDLPVEKLRESIESVLEDLDGEIGAVTRRVFDDETFEAFVERPAATRNHHAYRRGLAEHTWSMCRIAEWLVGHYELLYDGLEIDRDLLLAGVLLHDLGKVATLESDGPTHTYGLDGELVGHVADCVARIHDAAACELASDRTRRRLIHMVLAHHGKKEHGAPVEPKLLEAELLHQVDMIDSRVGMFRDALDGLEEGDISEWVKPLGGRVVG